MYKSKSATTFHEFLNKVNEVRDFGNDYGQWIIIDPLLGKVEQNVEGSCFTFGRIQIENIIFKREKERDKDKEKENQRQRQREECERQRQREECERQRQREECEREREIDRESRRDRDSYVFFASLSLLLICYYSYVMVQV